MHNSLYDLTPLLRMLCLGLIVAAGPLFWAYLRSRRASTIGRLQALTLVTLFLTFDLVLFGAFTRLTDSGLGCPDWPGCYGNASPVGAAEQIGQAQTAMPSGPVTQGKAWVEMIHRYLATAVGVLITALTASAWLARKSGGTGVAVNPWMPTVTLIWVCIQGAFGALTVTMKLFPAIVSLHLLGGYMLLALLTWQAVALQRAETTTSRIVVTLALRRGLIAALVILVLQAASGAWVSTNYAVLACSEFPQCQGGWWPAMHFAQGFELWRPLGMSGDGAHISFQALTAIHFAHRMLAVVTLLVLVSLTAAIWKVSALGYAPKLLAGLLALQAITGISNVVLDWPLIAAVLHTGGAGALLVVLVGLIATTKPSTATNPGFVFPRSLTQ